MARAELQAFAPVVRERVNALLADLQTLPHAFAATSASLDQGISIALQAPGQPPLWLELDLADQPGYARFGKLRASHQPHRLTEPQRMALHTALEVVAQHAAALQAPSPARETPAIRHVHAERVLCSGPGVPGDWYINPYVGCTIGCSYCNAQFRAADVRALDGRPERAWGTWLDAKIDAPARLREEVLTARPGSVVFSPVITDPYVPLEAKLGITRGCLEVLADAGFSAVVLTRSEVVLRDLDVLARLPKASVGVSLPALDDGWLQRIEPRGAPVSGRLAVLRAAREAGLQTFAVLQPLLATPLADWLAQLAPLVDAVRVDRLHEVPRVGQLFGGLQQGDVAATERAFANAGVATDLAGLFAHPRL